MKTVNMYMKMRLYPSKVDKNDKGENIVSIDKIESNIYNYRYIWNKELEFINEFRDLLLRYGFDNYYVVVNETSCNLLLHILRSYVDFLEKSESSSRQQAYRDLIIAFKRFYDPQIKSGYPKYKTEKGKQTCRIMNNNNNVRLQKNKYGGDRIKLASLGLVKFKTSKEYKILLRQGSDPNDTSVKIKHVTIIKEHGKYFAAVNIEYMRPIVEKDDKTEEIGIDIGCKNLSALSNENIIPNPDLTHEIQQIGYYQKIMSHHKKGSKRYNEALKLYYKWTAKKINKRNDYYHKESLKIIKHSNFISVQNENIKAWQSTRFLSRKIQINAPRIFLDMLEYKSRWNNVKFTKVPKTFPSTQICSKCGKRNKKIGGIGKLGIRNWQCPHCHEYHNRDINAAKNILNKGLQIVGTTMQ